MCQLSKCGNSASLYQGLRLDGRKAGELRRIQCRMGVYGQADGSAYLEQGNSKVRNLST
jgi:ribonuclease PH